MPLYRRAWEDRLQLPGRCDLPPASRAVRRRQGGTVLEFPGIQTEMSKVLTVVAQHRAHYPLESTPPEDLPGRIVDIGGEIHHKERHLPRFPKKDRECPPRIKPQDHSVTHVIEGQRSLKKIIAYCSLIQSPVELLLLSHLLRQRLLVIDLVGKKDKMGFATKRARAGVPFAHCLEQCETPPSVEDDIQRRA